MYTKSYNFAENLLNYARYNPYWTTYTNDATLPTNLTKSTTNAYRHSDSTVFPNSVHSKRMRKKNILQLSRKYIKIFQTSHLCF